MIKLAELEQCPINLTIHSLKKINKLEKIAKNNLNLLPALEVAILPNNRKFILKGHAIYEALQRLGIAQFNAHCHFVDDVMNAIILHAKLSQSDPINPLSVLELRDNMIKNGYDKQKIAEVCCLDPIYEKLLSCTLSSEAKEQLNHFLDLLSSKLSHVNMPPYIIEILSKRPSEIQADIVKSLFISITDEATLNDRDFVFPNPDQVRMYAELHKKSQGQNGLLFEEESVANAINSTNKKSRDSLNTNNEIGTMEKKIIENSPFMAIMRIGKKKYRLNWKTKTFAEINDENEKFTIIRDVKQLEKLYVFSVDSTKFLDLGNDDDIYYKTITNSKQLRSIASRIDPKLEFSGIVILNKNVL